MGSSSSKIGILIMNNGIRVRLKMKRSGKKS
jgi:hypothetical protein